MNPQQLGLLFLLVSVTTVPFATPSAAGFSIPCSASEFELAGRTLARLKLEFAADENTEYSEVAQDALREQFSDQFYIDLGCKLSEMDANLVHDLTEQTISLPDLLQSLELPQSKNVGQNEAILEIIRLMQQAAQKPKPVK